MQAQRAASVSRRSRLSRSSLLASSLARSCVARAEQLDNFRGHIHASCGIDARRETEGDIEAGDRLGGGIELAAAAKSARSPAPTGRRSSRSPSAAIDAILAVQRNRIGNGGDGGHLEKAGQQSFRGSRSDRAVQATACASLSAMAAPQSDFSG